MSVITEILLLILLIGHPNAGVHILPKETPKPVVLEANYSGVDTMIALVNSERQKRGLKTLTNNSNLNTSAKNKACDIVNDNYWSHTAPDGTTGWDFMIMAGYKYYYAGENLCRDYSSDLNCFNGLMESPTHRDNILSVNYREIGVGRCGNITVQHFGTRY